jgi:threonine dehydratase
MRLVTAADVATASALLARAPEATRPVRTPLLPAPSRPGLWLKPENLQPTGAFKIRGAAHALAALPEQERQRGVVAYSSGNHARAVAHAARAFGAPATVVVPRTAPEAKVAATRALGAEIVPVEVADRERRAAEIAAERGARLVPPFDDRDVIAGQGTVGREIAEDLEPDVVLVPISGGGLISGVAAAVKGAHPRTRVIGVEPELAADAGESFRAGRRITWPVTARTRTAADGLTAEPSELTFAHLRQLVDDVVAVGEEEIAEAVGWIAAECRVIAERSGAVTVAAHHHRELPAGRTVAVVSGGNIDPDQVAQLLRTP